MSFFCCFCKWTSILSLIFFNLENKNDFNSIYYNFLQKVINFEYLGRGYRFYAEYITIMEIFYRRGWEKKL